jgi:hypothetical protein
MVPGVSARVGPAPQPPLPRRTVLIGAPLGISVLLLPAAADASSPVPPDTHEVLLTILSTSGSDGVVTIVWEDDP